MDLLSGELMRQVWLHSNRRVPLSGMIVGLLLVAAGVLLVLLERSFDGMTSLLCQIVGGGALGLAAGPVP